METSELKNTIKIKNSINGINGRKKRTEERSVSLKTEQKKLSKMNKREKIERGKKEQSIRNLWGYNRKNLTFMPLKSQTEQEKAAGLIKY